MSESSGPSGDVGNRRFAVISSDCHAGANLDTYRGYLDASFLEEFDAWRGKYSNPFSDLKGTKKLRNWDNAIRDADLLADGVVGEVIFPNTVPPFFPTGVLISYPPRSQESYRRRLAGIRAHNRWLVDFCSEYPNRRIGLAQIFLNDVDDAIEDATWAANQGLKGVLVPAIPPDQGIPPFFTDHYDRFWAACQDLDLVVTQHGGSGVPNYGRNSQYAFLMLMEVGFFANRTLWHLIITGVFERFSRLKFAMTEQGVGWLPQVLERLDSFWLQMRSTGHVGELEFKVDDQLPMKPSEYFARNCWVGASFPGPSESDAIRQLGVDRVMWGNDYPHLEGTFPHSRESLRLTFAGWSDSDLEAVLSSTAASLYGVDREPLADLVAKHGPSLAEISQPLTELPQSASPAFSRAV